MRERIRGAVLASAVGDALGAPVAFFTDRQIRARYGEVRELDGGGPFLPGETSDESALVLALASAYREGDFLPRRAAQSLFDLWRGPGKNIGTQTATALALVAAGEAALEEAGTTHRLRHPRRAAGNGSLSRCAATGLLRRSNDPRLVEEAVTLSALTHADPRATASCVALCAVLSSLVEGAEPAAAMSRAEALASSLSVEVAALLRRVREGRPPVYMTEPMGFVLLALERGLTALRDAEALEPALIDVANQGGDSDTHGTVAGVLLGARFGEAAIPARWLAALRDRPRFEAHADHLCALALRDQETALTPCAGGASSSVGPASP